MWGVEGDTGGTGLVRCMRFKGSRCFALAVGVNVMYVTVPCAWMLCVVVGWGVVVGCGVCTAVVCGGRLGDWGGLNL